MNETRKEQIVKGVTSLVAAGFVISMTKDSSGTLPCLTAFVASTIGNWVAEVS